MSNDEIVRISCAQGSCGSFPMDRAVRDRLKRTGQPFCCPAGHKQQFKTSDEPDLRERIKNLEAALERKDEEIDEWRNDYHQLIDELMDVRKRARFLESDLLDRVDNTGVVQVGPESYKWVCSCGSRGRKAFDDQGEALEAYRKHIESDHCDADLEEQQVIADV